MKTTEQTMDGLVTITYLEEQKCYGHYPFQMIVDRANGKVSMSALALGSNSEANYAVAKKEIDEGKVDSTKKVNNLYLSLDFPKMNEMDKDFVAIISFEEGEYSICGLPYDTEDGKTYPIIEKSELLDTILQEFKTFVEK